MKKLITKLLLPFLCLTFTSCTPKEEKEITCSQVIEKYEGLGYEIFHEEDVIGEDDYSCMVRVENKDENEYIFFYFFTSKESANKYAKENKYSFITYLFSIALGDPTWVHVETYNNIEIEYIDKELYKPFLELTK